MVLMLLLASCMHKKNDLIEKNHVQCDFYMLKVIKKYTKVINIYMFFFEFHAYIMSYVK